ncbi:3,9-dihydroxypterocarpan 6A-monooxygenase-like [Coffea arabica]|uniref:3,9-dihydroxypterocarpan 6A-monooxygenase-like n=1 Tax=Coffea arabica TaxID=13443 RepID=A0ABM4UQL8_COFAR
MSELLGGRTLDLMFPIRHSEVKNLIQSFATSAKASKAVDIRAEVMTTTNNVISEMIMSQKCSGNDSQAMEVRKAIQEGSELYGQFNLSDLFWLCENLDLQGLGKRLKKEIRKQRQPVDGEAAKDLHDILLDISEDESSKFKLIEENIKAFILDVFTGGTDTLAIAVEWALAELSFLTLPSRN